MDKPRPKSGEAEKNFTSMKLDLIDAITCDTGISDIDKLVGIRILQHVRSATGLANPSEERIAAQLDKSPDTVKRSVRRLKKLWLQVGRPNRQKSNVYRFIKNRINLVTDATVIREEEARERSIRKQKYNYDRAKLPHQDCVEGANDAAFEGANHTLPEGADLHPKHLHKNYLHGTPQESPLVKEVVGLGLSDATASGEEGYQTDTGISLQENSYRRTSEGF